MAGRRFSFVFCLFFFAFWRHPREAAIDGFSLATTTSVGRTCSPGFYEVFLSIASDGFLMSQCVCVLPLSTLITDTDLSSLTRLGKDFFFKKINSTVNSPNSH